MNLEAPTLCRSVDSFEEWRGLARPLLAAGVEPRAIEWRDKWQGTELPAQDSALFIAPAVRLPRKLMHLLETVANFRHAGRWELMYRLAFRTLRENSHLLEDAADPDVRNAALMERAVRRDCHKMHAFVRFREVADSAGAASYFAWFTPEHEILRRASSFFIKRFCNMKWTIATPDGAAVWDGHEIQFVETGGACTGPQSDVQERLWRTYYRSICNVARINPAAMKREMPQRYWRHLPEAAEIGGLLRDGLSNFAAGTSDLHGQGTNPAKAVRRALAALPAAGEGPHACRRCELWRHATQAVPGSGPAHAAVMLVGEQPGDEEDLRGQCFVGPAGGVLNEAITAAGLTRSDLFITNAVKHFKWEPRGKRRIHSKPDSREIDLCNIWLQQEIATCRPSVLVALGGSALRALTGTAMSIESARAITLRYADGTRIIATYHPAAILRAQRDQAALMRQCLIHDLVQARTHSAISSFEGMVASG